jgi:hypothetical protein
MDPNNGKKSIKWEPEEDVKLTQAVKMHGNDWVAVAAMVPGRARHQCYKRWTDALDPSNNGKTAGTWNPEEDRKLTKAVKMHGNDWVAVATLVPGRTNNQCHIRWTRSLDSSNNGKKGVLGKQRAEGGYLESRRGRKASRRGEEAWKRLGRSCCDGS